MSVLIRLHWALEDMGQALQPGGSSNGDENGGGGAF